MVPGRAPSAQSGAPASLVVVLDDILRAAEAGEFPPADGGPTVAPQPAPRSGVADGMRLRSGDRVS